MVNLEKLLKTEVVFFHSCSITFLLALIRQSGVKYKREKTHNVIVATQSLLDEYWDGGEQRVESPVVGKVDNHESPDRRRGQDLEPRSLYVPLQQASHDIT